MGHSVPPVSRSPTPSPIRSHSVPVEMHNPLRKQTLPTEIASDGVLSYHSRAPMLIHFKAQRPIAVQAAGLHQRQMGRRKVGPDF